LAENLNRAIDNRPPIKPRVLAPLLLHFSVKDEDRLLEVVENIRKAFNAFYKDVLKLTGEPLFTIETLRIAKRKKKEYWNVVVKEVEKLGKKEEEE